MTDLYEKINSFLASVQEAPAQKSPEWYLLKSKTIGGSEIATVLGKNPYSKVKMLIAEKAGVPSCQPFRGNTATRWGTVFEELTRQWVEIILSMEQEIKETGSLPGVIDRQRYSPDGLGVVKLLNEKDQPEYYIALFEFKSPFRSIPDGKIPKHYRPQIQTGMITIPNIDFSIFVNNCYRKCTLKQIGFNTNYDTVFHDGDLTKKLTKAQKITQVYACGVIGFYQTADNYKQALKLCGYGSDDSDSELDLSDVEIPDYSTSSAYDMELLMNTKEAPLDLGTAKQRITDRLFELYEEKRISVKYYPMIVNQEVVNEMEFIQLHNKQKPISDLTDSDIKKIIKKQIIDFNNFCEESDSYVIGYLPWKLMKSDVLLDSPEEGWKEYIQPYVEDALQKIDEIAASDDKEAAFNRIFQVEEDSITMVEDSDLFKSGL